MLNLSDIIFLRTAPHNFSGNSMNICAVKLLPFISYKRLC